MHLVRRGHFLHVTWQRWLSYQWIRHTRKPHATRKPHGAIFYGIGVMGDLSLHCGNRNFRPFCSGDLDLDPMTFIYEHDRYSREIHRMCKYVLPTSRISTVIVRHTYRQFTHGHFRSRDKDGVYTICSAVFKNPVVRANLMTIFYRTGVIGDRSLHCGNRHCGRFGLL